MARLLSSYAVQQVFGITGNLSCSLQSATATVCGSMEAVLDLVNQLQELRSEPFFLQVAERFQSQIASVIYQAILRKS